MVVFFLLLLLGIILSVVFLLVARVCCFITYVCSYGYGMEMEHLYLSYLPFILVRRSPPQKGRQNKK